MSLYVSQNPQNAHHQMKSESVSHQSSPILCDPMDCSPPGLCPWNSPGKYTGVGSHSFPQCIFLIQESNPCLLHCRQIPYHLSHHRRPTTLSMNHNINYGLRVIKACQCKFMDCNKGTTLVRDVASERGIVYIWKSISDNCMLSTQFC